MTRAAEFAAEYDQAVAAERDRGAATVWAVGAIAVVMSVMVFGLHLGEAILTRHQAESAADLAALAAAGAVLAGEQYACGQARRVTDRMRVHLMSCRTRGWDALVEVTARPAGRLAHLGGATGRARAGPAALYDLYDSTPHDSTVDLTSSSLQYAVMTENRRSIRKPVHKRSWRSGLR